jgi:hypothetical protein
MTAPGRYLSLVISGAKAKSRDPKIQEPSNTRHACSLVKLSNKPYHVGQSNDSLHSCTVNMSHFASNVNGMAPPYMLNHLKMNFGLHTPRGLIANNNLPEWPSQLHWRQKQTLRHLKQNAQSSVRKNVGSLAFSTSKRFGRLQKRIRITRCGGGGVSQPIYSPITVRSQSDLQSDHSPITVRSYVLIAFRFNHSKK